MSRLTTSQERLIKATLTAKPYPLTAPCFGFAKTSLSLQKERDVAQRQGEVTFPLLIRLSITYSSFLITYSSL
jgi:hypothetical protein